MTAALLILGGLVFSFALSRRVQKEGPLLPLVLSSYCLRVLLTLAFFVTSAWQLPVLSGLQIEGGFWQFAPDAASYHSSATQTAEAWRRGEPLSFPGSWYPFVVALLYRLCGPSPLHAAVLNAWADSLAIIFGYLIALRLAGQRAGLRAAALIAFWPSSLIWSTQLLKESLCAALILGVLCTVVWLCAEETGEGHRKTPILRISLWLAVGAGVALLSCLRPYMGVILWASVLAAFSLAGTMSLLRRQPFPLWSTCGLVLLLSAGLLGARLLPSPRPEVDSFTLGVSYQERGELEKAALQYRQALWMNPRYAEACHNLGGVWLRQGRLSEAVKAYRHCYYLAAGSGEGQRPVQTAIQQIQKIMILPEAERDMAIRSLLAHLSQIGGEVVDEGKAKRKLYKVLREIKGILGEFSLIRLGKIRKGSVSTGGHSLFDPEVRLNRLTDALSYLPRGLAYTLFAPFPWQWFDTRGSTGLFKSAAAVEVISVYLLLPLALRGAVWLARRGRSDGFVVVVFTMGTATLLSLTIANGGTLFRLRLQCLLPLLVITGIGGSRATHPGSL